MVHLNGRTCNEEVVKQKIEGELGKRLSRTPICLPDEVFTVPVTSGIYLSKRMGFRFKQVIAMRAARCKRCATSPAGIGDYTARLA